MTHAINPLLHAADEVSGIGGHSDISSAAVGPLSGAGSGSQDSSNPSMYSARNDSEPILGSMSYQEPSLVFQPASFIPIPGETPGGSTHGGGTVLNTDAQPPVSHDQTTLPQLPTVTNQSPASSNSEDLALDSLSFRILPSQASSEHGSCPSERTEPGDNTGISPLTRVVDSSSVYASVSPAHPSFPTNPPQQEEITGGASHEDPDITLNEIQRLVEKQKRRMQNRRDFNSSPTSLYRHQHATSQQPDVTAAPTFPTRTNTQSTETRQHETTTSVAALRDVTPKSIPADQSLSTSSKSDISRASNSTKEPELNKVTVSQNLPARSTAAKQQTTPATQTSYGASGATPQGATPNTNPLEPPRPSSPKKSVDLRLQVRKYQLMISRNKLPEALSHFNTAISDNEMPRTDKATMVEVGSKLAKLLIKEHSNYFEALQILKKCAATIDDIGAVGRAESTTHWEVHDDIAVCYRTMEQGELEAKHYEIAIDLLSKASTQPERYPHMMNNLGNCYKKLRRYPEARDVLEKAKTIMVKIHGIDDSKPFPETLQKVFSSLAECYKLMDLQDRAVQEYEFLLRRLDVETTSLTEKIRLLDVKRNLAQLYRLEGETRKADALNVPDEEETDRDGKLISNLMRLGNEAQDASASQEPVAKAVAHAIKIRKAQTYDRAGDDVNAIRFYEEALEDIKNGGQALGEAIDKPNVVSSIHNNVGTCYLSTGQYAQAEKHLSEAVRIRIKRFGPDGVNDDLASSYYNLGNLYCRMNREAQAIPNYRHAIRIYQALAPDGKPEFTTWLARSYKALGQAYQEQKAAGHDADAARAYEKAKEIYEGPTSCGDLGELQAVLNNLGNAYEGLRDYVRAQDTLKQSVHLADTMLQEKVGDVDLMNKKAASLNNLGIAYRSNGKLEMAAEQLVKCCDLRLELIQNLNSTEAMNDYPGSLQSLAKCWEAPQYREKAKDYFKKAIEKYKQSGNLTQQSRIALSVCYENIGDTESALDILEE